MPQPANKAVIIILIICATFGLPIIILILGFLPVALNLRMDAFTQILTFLLVCSIPFLMSDRLYPVIYGRLHEFSAAILRVLFVLWVISGAFTILGFIIGTGVADPVSYLTLIPFAACHVAFYLASIRFGKTLR